MKVALFGGSGHVGAVLQRHFQRRGDEVHLVGRTGPIVWDGKTLGPWVEVLACVDVVINLAGRSVNCRYNAANLAHMMSSRVDSTRIVGEAIAASPSPPRVWLQMSTATIYAHRFDAPNTESTGILGGDEPGAPPKWNASIAIAKAWEAALESAETPHTCKVAMRSAMVMSPDAGSVFDTLRRLTLKGLGGRLGSGKQYMSWIHEHDFARAVQFLIDHELQGPVNLASPNPLPQANFARALRWAAGVRLGLPATNWILELGCLVMRTESELVLKSRRVVPERLLKEGYRFEFPEWVVACRDLINRSS